MLKFPLLKLKSVEFTPITCFDIAEMDRNATDLL